MKEKTVLMPYAFADGRVHSIEIAFCSVKNLNMRVKDGRVVVKVPFSTPYARIKTFLQKHEKWLSEQLEKEIKKEDAVYLVGKRYDVTVVEGKKGARYQEDKLILSVPSGEVADAKAYCKKVYKKSAEEYFLSRVAELFPVAQAITGIADLPKVVVRYCTSYWGKCFYTRSEIRLNAYLFQAPREVIDYVILHEYAHFSVHDHSKKFYATVGAMMPDYAHWKSVEKKYRCAAWFDS